MFDDPSTYLDQQAIQIILMLLYISFNWTINELTCRPLKTKMKISFPILKQIRSLIVSEIPFWIVELFDSWLEMKNVELPFVGVCELLLWLITLVSLLLVDDGWTFKPSVNEWLKRFRWLYSLQYLVNEIRTGVQLEVPPLLPPIVLVFVEYVDAFGFVYSACGTNL